MPISYYKATFKSKNPLARLSHRSRFKLAAQLVDRYCTRGGALLDFGANDGNFLRQLGEAGFAGRRYGYDAFKTPIGNGISAVHKLSDISESSLSIITALETLEHLYPEDLESFLAFAIHALQPGGRLIISVPIMIGPALFLKYINARFLNKSVWRYTFAELIRGGILLKDVKRDASERYMNHKGFDFRGLRERLLKTDFVLVHQQYSPFSAFGFVVNSQIFFVFEKPIQHIFSDSGIESNAKPTEKN